MHSLMASFLHPFILTPDPAPTKYQPGGLLEPGVQSDTGPTAQHVWPEGLLQASSRTDNKAVAQL